MLSELVSASLDFYRGMRDAVSEMQFYQIYGSIFSFYLADKEQESEPLQEEVSEKNSEAFRQQALASIAKGGYPEALARVFALLERHGVPLPLARVQLKHELAAKFADLLPETSMEEQRRIRGLQDLIVRYAPERAMSTLPQLLAKPADRNRLRTL